jgi:DnaJ-class molecular chaperone
MPQPPAYQPTGSTDGVGPCADCAGQGLVPDPPPGHLAAAGYFPGDACPTCNGSGITGLLERTDPGENACD